MQLPCCSIKSSQEFANSNPAAKLAIVGRHPPANLVERARQTAGVELLADVPDVRPFSARARHGGAVRIGGGSRLKIFEALACGLAVVSTKVGAEGLLLTSGVDYVQADEEAMADALVRRPAIPARCKPWPSMVNASFWKRTIGASWPRSWKPPGRKHASSI